MGMLYFADIDIETGSYGAPVDLYTSTETLALAPADWEVVYACYLQSDHIKRIVRIIWRMTASSGPAPSTPPTSTYLSMSEDRTASTISSPARMRASAFSI